MKSSASAFEPGDVLYGRLRPYLNKVWLADRRGACSGELLVLRPNDKIAGRYLALQLHAMRFVQFASHAVSGDRPRIDFSTIAQFEIPLPPRPVQEAILARVDEIFAEIDDGEAALADARAGVETYRKALLKAAVTGELTADWRRKNPPKETGQDFLRRLIGERSGHKYSSTRERAKKTAPPKCDIRGLPENWGLTTIGALLADGPQNGIYVPQSQYGAGVPIYRIDDFQTGLVREALILRKVKIDRAAADLYGLRPGDFVVNRVNSPSHLGKLFVANSTNVPSVYESNMMRFRLVDGISSSFIEMYLKSDFGRGLLVRDAKAAVNQSSINQGDVCTTPVPVPPSEEQERIVGAVQYFAKVCDDGYASLAGGYARAATLRQSILSAAFRGELVS